MKTDFNFIILLLMLNTINGFTQSEPNGSALQATAISTGTLYHDSLVGTDTEDWFRINLPVTARVNITILKPQPGSFTLHLRDSLSPGFPIIQSLFFSNDPTPELGTILTAYQGTGLFFIQLIKNTNTPGYAIKVDYSAPIYGNDQESNDSPETAVAVFGTNIVGNTGYYLSGKGIDEADWFRIKVDQNGILKFKIHTKGNSNAYFFLKDKSNPSEFIVSVFASFDSPEDGYLMEMPVLKGEFLLFIQSSGSANRHMDYKVETNLIPPQWGSDREPNNAIIEADTLRSDSIINGTLGYFKEGIGLDLKDIYFYHPPSNGRLFLELYMKGNNSSGYLRVFHNQTMIDEKFINETYLSVPLKLEIQAVDTSVLRFELTHGYLRPGFPIDYTARFKWIKSPLSDFAFYQSDYQVSFENQSQGVMLSYLWSFDDSTPISTAINPFHRFTMPGVYDVCLTTTNVAGGDTKCKRLEFAGLSRINPMKGGNTGDVTITIIGGGLDNDFNVVLIRNGTEIKKTSEVRKGIKDELFAKFDLRNAPIGLCDIKVFKNQGPEFTLKGAFEIITGNKADPWIRISGRNKMLLNTPTTYTVEVGNNGNVDATVVPVYMYFSDQPNFELKILNEDNVIIPDTIDSDVQNGLAAVKYTLENGKKLNVYPMLIPIIPPGTTKSFKIKIKASSDISMGAWAEKPWFQSPINDFKVSCILDNVLNQADEEIKNVIDVITLCFLDEFYNRLTRIQEIKPKNDSLSPARFIVRYIGAISSSLRKCGIHDKTLRATITDYITREIIRIGLGRGWVSFNRNGCEKEFEAQNPVQTSVRIVTSLDPNEKTGLPGYSDYNYTRSITLNHPYTIHFENKATATAPAHTVLIIDTMDTNTFDIHSFEFSDISIGDSVLTVATGAKHITEDFYVPSTGVMVRVQGDADTTTGIVRWLFRSLDAITLEDIEDPDIGFLHPNVTSPEGQGSVSFNVQLRHTPRHLDIVKNNAHIYFDANEPIATNINRTMWDIRSPESRVKATMHTENPHQIILDWSGTDDGSGISHYNIYFSENGGPDSLLWSFQDAGSDTFTVKLGHKYNFYSVALDNVGNIESIPVTPDVSLVISSTNHTLVQKQAIRVIHAPGTNEVGIQCNGGTCKGWISVYSLTGSLIDRFRLDDKNLINWDITSLPTGMYIWEYQNFPYLQKGKVVKIR